MFKGRINVSQHAIDESIRDFRVPKLTAEDWVRSNLRKSTFISDIVGEDGRPCRLFAFQRIAFILDASDDRVITVYPRHHAVTTLQTKVQAVVTRELRNAKRKLAATERLINVQKAQLNVEAAQCDYRMAITPSQAVIRSNTERKIKLAAKMSLLDAELLDAKKEYSAVAKSVVTYV